MESSSEREMEDGTSDITFSPPVYRQRYQRVLDIVREVKPKKIVDFGCAECKFLRLLKNERIEEIIGVDIDRSVLERNAKHVRPLFTDFLRPRSTPLCVRLYKGSLSDYDVRLEGCDMVTLIEVVEHLTPETLIAMPENIFGILNPKTVVITTPNADFNVMFKLNGKFRHWDHKFEWTRVEFETWCTELARRFDYTVSFFGVGPGPPGSEKLGCCTQMAVFQREQQKSVNNGLLNCDQTKSPYLLVEECVHPQEKEIDKMFKITSFLEEAIQNVVCAYEKQEYRDITLPWEVRGEYCTVESCYQAKETKGSLSKRCECESAHIDGQFDDSRDDLSVVVESQCCHREPEDFWRPARKWLFRTHLYETYFKEKQENYVEGQFDDAPETNFDTWPSISDDMTPPYYFQEVYWNGQNKDVLEVPLESLMALGGLKSLDMTKCDIIAALQGRCDAWLSEDGTCVVIDPVENIGGKSSDDMSEDELEKISLEQVSLEKYDPSLYSVEDFFEENWDE